MPYYPFSHSFEWEAPASVADRELYSSRPPAWESGVEGEARPVTPGADTGILAIVVAVIVLIGLNMRYVRHLFKSLPQDLLSVRRRANVFDEHTANETRVVLLQLLQLWVYEGILLFMWQWNPTGEWTPGRVLSVVGAMIGVAALFNLFQMGACATLGYVFADRVGATQWRRGLNASQILLGWSVMIPALVALFYPGMAGAMLLAAAVLYVVWRLCFISKGFRIFYENLGSLLYFILYLCTLEIIPVIVGCLLAAEICTKL